MKSLGYLLCTIAYVVFSTIATGLVVSTLWGWFVVPTFSMPPLSIPAAFGLALIERYIAVPRNRDPEKSKQPYGEWLREEVLWGAVKPAFALGVGWIVKMWM